MNMHAHDHFGVDSVKCKASINLKIKVPLRHIVLVKVMLQNLMDVVTAKISHANSSHKKFLDPPLL